MSFVIFADVSSGLCILWKRHLKSAPCMCWLQV